MPRKVRVPAARDDNRLSQQRSRARHKEYVDGLEKRIRDYEQKGVQATIEMQRVARDVTSKNEKLLALLALHGVRQDEIDTFLSDGYVPIPSLGASQYRYEPIQIPSPCCPPKHAQPSFEIQAYPGSSADMVRQSFGPPCPAYRVQVAPYSMEGEGETHNFVPYDTPGSIKTSSSTPPESPTELTSCETAAAILANLRGTADVTEARATLGCENSRSCSIRNTHLFQLMNEVP
ncbi:hypothetical protein BX600DRAFT_465248 [Xylariales sp. PMI_506]|nr:hypothetical protein BX600DRAFT_465248 [Xylariales sp. PMI_506]